MEVTAPDGAGQWLPVAPAAERLGLTERTLRRHLTAGAYPSRRHAGHVEVLVPVSAGTPDSAGLADWRPAATPAAPDTTITQAVAALERALQAERERADTERARALDAERRMRDDAAAAAMWQERARNLEAENAKLQELLALPPHEEEPSARWWQWWRRKGQYARA